MKNPLQPFDENKTPSGLETSLDSAGLAPHRTNREAKSEEVVEVNLRGYWRVVRKHLWLVVGITLLMTTAIFVLTGLKPDYYRARARVQINLENFNPAASAAQNGTTALSADPAYFNTQLQILNSPALLRRVAQTLDLEYNDIYRRNMTKGGRTLRKLFRLFYIGTSEKNDAADSRGDSTLTNELSPSVSADNLAEAERLAPIVEDLQRRLTIEPVKEARLAFKETRLVEITFEHPSSQLAAKIANAISDAFVLANLEEKRRAGASANDFLTYRIAELQAQIRRGEERLLNYAKNNQILTLDPAQNTVVERLTGLNRQLLEAENDRTIAEANYRAALAPNAVRALAEDSQKEITAAEQNLAALEQRRASLLVENTEKWPEVREVNQQIAALQRQLKDVRERATATVLTNLETRYKQALAREQTLRDSFNRQRGDTLNQNEAAVNYRIIQQEIDTNKGLLEAMLQRFKENDVLLAGTTNNIRVVDYALTPDAREPDGPWRLLFVLLALAFSLSASIGLAFFLEYIDNRLRSSEDVETILQLPTLAVIPTVGGFLRRRLLPAVGVGGNGHGRAALIVGCDPQSPLSEEYRRLRTAVTLPMNGHSPKKILIASSTPGEGKTTTAVNIAASLAQTGGRVLLIDADMRRPRVHWAFDLDNEQGLSTILSDKLEGNEALKMIVRHESSGIDLLLAGETPQKNPAELLVSNEMRSLMTRLEAVYTHIVIDSPAVMSFTDSSIISTFVDGVILIINSSKSSREVVRHTLRELQDMNANLLGVVLNNADPRLQEYYHYSY